MTTTQAIKPGRHASQSASRHKLGGGNFLYHNYLTHKEPASRIIARLAVLTAVCAAMLLLFTGEASPLFADFNSDYAVFHIVAQGWLDGMIPYQSLFDHKGPMIYLLYLLGLLISPGKIGIFILELIFAVTTFELLFRCGRTLGISNRLNYAALTVGLILMSGLIEGGATVEEWSLPFQVLPLLLGLRWMLGHTDSIVPASFVSGLCFGLVAMIRLNDNNIICGLCIGIVIALVIRRRYADILRCIGMFTAGTILAVLPFIIYFAAKSALDDFIYANFTYNLHYRSEWAEPDTLMSLLRKLLRLTPCFVAPVVSVIYDRRTNSSITASVAAMSIFTIYAFLPGNGFSHYYLMAMPLGVLAVQMSGSLGRNLKLLVMALVCGPVALYYCGKPIEGYRNILRRRTEIAVRGNDQSLTRLIKAVIPETDRDSVYIYGGESSAHALIETGHFPVGKYFFGQIKHFKVDDRICQDIGAQFEQANPRWIVAHLSVSRCEPLQPLLDRYEELPADSISVALPEQYHIYRRK